MLADKAFELDVIIVGAGAAGLMCAIAAGGRGKKTLVLERSKKAGSKILISGGGRCNFTNLHTPASSYISENMHFAKSALSSYTPDDFMDLLTSNGVTWHEKTLGQLFCDQGAGKILDVLLRACAEVGAEVRLNTDIAAIDHSEGVYVVKTSRGTFTAPSLVMASGGISIPKMGATPFSYEIARQFGLPIVPTEAALVPLVFAPDLVAEMKTLAGVSADCIVRCGKAIFRENLLFTHRGLSGPAILQISSYWQQGDTIEVNLLPDVADSLGWLKSERTLRAKVTLKTILKDHFSERLAEWLAAPWPGNIADLSNKSLEAAARRLSAWQLEPTGSEGFAKAEVTRGGVSTKALSSKTMEARTQPGLYFIGECVDVTGWLGGYNFQWAWASGHACGHAV
ncbi:MAG: aminoacetone oxidase family FAD-binding enzyme [Kordiimonadales bacterium]|nr:MAG: aminoacetone oxidase family FAD-binding enzyme [Kordiimonadales bacterium]